MEKSLNIQQLAKDPLWEKLKKETRPILLYGMGNGADKILAICERLSIKVSGVFASDGFVRNKAFHGMQIRSYAESKEIFGENIVVLLSFATSRDEVLENILKIASECELYAPDVPVYGDNIFDQEFLFSHEHEIQKAYSLLCDERSRKLFTDIIKYKITGKIKYLASCDEENDYMNSILHAKEFRSYVDAGAYKGDTILSQKAYSPDLSKIFAIEPDPSTYKKLCGCMEDNNIAATCFNYALSNEEGEMTFHGGGGRGSTLNSTKKATKIILTNKLDSLLKDEKSSIDFIKYDVEGSEYDALCGSIDTITLSRPSMLVSLYHRSEDIFKLPCFISEIYENASFYLRRAKGIPAWDINLLVVPK